MPRKHNPTMQTIYLLIVRLLLASVTCIEMDLFAELPIDEDTAFRRLADEHKRLCYRHSTCSSVMSEGFVAFPTTEENSTSGSTNSSSSTECVDRCISCCGHCTCDADCIRYGTCCLGVYRDFNHALQSSQNTRYGCVLPQYLTNEKSDFNGKDIHYWMITKCDPDYPYDETRELCENPGLDGSPESIVPVTGSRLQVHYRNRYCHHCHRFEREESFIYWTLDINNNDYISIPNENLLMELKQQRGNIFFVPPSYVVIEKCDVLAFQISACNETGQWKTYNKYVETACKSFLDPFNNTYKNYFCYLCNIAEIVPEDTWQCPKEYQLDDITGINPSFFAILDITDIKDERAHNQLHCGSNQFQDELMMHCRDVLCHKDRVLANGDCLPRPERVTNTTCFSAFIRLNPLFTSPRIDGRDPFIKLHIEESLTAELSVCDGIENKFIIFVHTNDLYIVDYFVVMIVVYVPVNESYCYKYSFIETLNAVHSGNVTVTGYTNTPIDFGVEAAVYNTTVIDGLQTLSVPNMLDLTPHTLKTDYHELLENPCNRQKLIKINKLFFCPFIMLGKDEMSIAVENDFLFLADIENPNMTLKIFSKWEYEIHDSYISICLEDFADIYNVLLESESSILNQLAFKEPEAAKYILALACVSVSIACLFVTIFTYIKHPPLHSQPGINNVVLCIFLLLAQTMYQFGAGQTSLSNFACSLIGAICHFLWLSVMFSMNICCIQMFTIFRKQTKLSSKFDTWQTMKHVLYVTCSTSLFVFINMVVSLVSSNGGSIGYGGKICYLSSNLMQLITFVAPSALTLVVNIILFTYVVYMIRKVSSANLLAKERNYLGVYARLSTLTGLTWVFGFLRLVFETDVLEYLFIIFNAGQGVFIMTAFVLNRRVLSLIFRKDKSVLSETPTDLQATRRVTIN